MTRKVITVRIDDDGRDKGKVFQVTEASAVVADKWGIRAMLALNKQGADIPDEILKMGIVGILAIGIHKLRGVAWVDLEPLLDEIMGCVKFIPTPDTPNVVRELVSEDIEEIGTLAILRKETFALHMGFSPPGAPSTFPKGAAGQETS